MNDRIKMLAAWLDRRAARALWVHEVGPRTAVTAYAIAGQVAIVVTYGIGASDGFDIFTSERTNAAIETFADAEMRLGIRRSLCSACGPAVWPGDTVDAHGEACSDCGKTAIYRAVVPRT